MPSTNQKDKEAKDKARASARASSSRRNQREEGDGAAQQGENVDNSSVMAREARKIALQIATSPDYHGEDDNSVIARETRKTALQIATSSSSTTSGVKHKKPKAKVEDIPKRQEEEAGSISAVPETTWEGPSLSIGGREPVATSNNVSTGTSIGRKARAMVGSSQGMQQKMTPPSRDEEHSIKKNNKDNMNDGEEDASLAALTHKMAKRSLRAAENIAIAEMEDSPSPPVLTAQDHHVEPGAFQFSPAHPPRRAGELNQSVYSTMTREESSSEVNAENPGARQEGPEEMVLLQATLVQSEREDEDDDFKESPAAVHALPSKVVEAKEVNIEDDVVGIKKRSLLIGGLILLLVVGVVGVVVGVMLGGGDGGDGSGGSSGESNSAGGNGGGGTSDRGIPTPSPSVASPKSSGSTPTPAPSTILPTGNGSTPTPAPSTILPTSNGSTPTPSPSTNNRDTPMPAPSTISPTNNRDTPTQAPSTISPTSDSNVPPITDPGNMVIIDDFQVSLPVETQQSLQDPTSPQSRALAWLGGNTGLAEYNDVRLLQRFVMATLYYATNGDEWTVNTGWLSNEDECTWSTDSGTLFTCTEQTLDLLELIGRNLSGEIPRELGYLTSLLGIDFSENNLVGNIPTTLGLLLELESLWFFQNSLTGTIPTHLGALTRLQILDLENNWLQSPIPSQLQQLVFLEEIWLNWNDFSEVIPAWLPQFSRLDQLHMDVNGFEGPIPTQLALLQSVSVIDLSDTFLTGDIPSQLALLPNLNTLHLYNTLLSGSVPAELCSRVTNNGLNLAVDCEFVVCNCNCDCSWSTPLDIDGGF